MKIVPAAHPGGFQLTSRAARLAGLRPGMSLLDVGCGVGASLETLARECGIVPFGVDISGDLIAVARDRMPGAALRVCDAAALPFADESFDAVICECTLSLVGDAAAVLRESARVLMPGGTLIASDVCSPDDFDRIKTSFESAGLSVTHFEEHKPALITYAAELRMNAKIPPREHAPPRLPGTTPSTYYLAICKKQPT